MRPYAVPGPQPPLPRHFMPFAKAAGARTITAMPTTETTPTIRLVLIESSSSQDDRCGRTEQGKCQQRRASRREGTAQRVDPDVPWLSQVAPVRLTRIASTPHVPSQPPATACG